MKLGDSFGDRVHDDEPGGDDLGRANYPLQSIGHQQRAESLPAEFLRKCQPCEQYCRDLGRTSPVRDGQVRSTTPLNREGFLDASAGRVAPTLNPPPLGPWPI